MDWFVVVKYPHEYRQDMVLRYDSEDEARTAAEDFAKGSWGMAGYAQASYGQMVTVN